MEKFVKNNTIFLTIAGSRMYGTSTPYSDIDKRGVCVPPKEYLLGFAKKFDQQEVPGEDTIIYSLNKFMELATKCNPNIIELLFAPEDCIEITTPLWKKLTERRYEFLSAKAYHTFTGYALSQLKRIKTHRNWLLNPPKQKPSRSQFGLNDNSAGVRATAKGVDLQKVSPELLAVVKKEQNYKSALAEWKQYQNWKKNRNPVRAKLEAKYGYDTKHASHSVRLLRMGKEILTIGELIVKRPDADELLNIRNGAWSYEYLMGQIEPLQLELEEIYNNKKYVIPYKVDIEQLSNLSVELHEQFWES